jgi:hypothetical protein
MLLAVHILSAQDAFQLSALKAEAKVVADQREAINRQIEAASSPEALASKARSLGMRPSNTPVFLNLDAVDQALANGEIKRG